MAPAGPPSTITLKVKVPPGYVEGGADDHSLGTFKTSAHVRHVRQRIQETLPSHPAPEKQRLLFAGRALVDDEQTLVDALNTRRDTSQTEYVLHLLIRSEGNNHNAPSAHRRVVSMSASSPATSAPQPTDTPTQAQVQGQAQPAPPGQPPHAQVNVPLANFQAQLQQQSDAMHQAMHQQAIHQQALHQQAHQMHLRHQMIAEQMAQAQRMGGVVPLIPGQPIRAGAPGFNQAIQMGQQQRAGMGMHGVGGQQNGQNALSFNAQQIPAQLQGMQPNGLTPQPYSSVPGASNASNTSTQEGVEPSERHADAPQGVVLPADGTNGHPPLPQAPPNPGAAPQLGPYPRVDGGRFQIHHHVQTFNVPVNLPQPAVQNWGFPNILPQGLLPQGMLPQGMMPQGMQPAAMQAQGMQPQGIAPTALDRAREDMAEMRRLIDEMRAGTTDQGQGFEEQSARLGQLQQAVNDYIDPLHLGAGGRERNGRPSGSGAAMATPHVRTPPPPRPTLPPMAMTPPPSNHPPAIANLRYHPPAQTRNNARTQMQPPVHSTNPNAVTCYLCSSPQGPQALIFSPQHGTYATSLGSDVQRSVFQATIPTTQVTSARARQLAQMPYQQAPNAAAAAIAAGVTQQQPGIVADPAQAVGAPQAQAVNQQQQPQQQQRQDQPVDGMNAALGQFWLLFRILIFAYFLLGANMGWRRPIALMMIGFGFWMVRLGLFGQGGIARRWWDDLIRVGPPPAGPAAVAGNGQAGRQQQGAPPHGADGTRQPMPTPEQVAQRLLDERQQVRDARMQRLREFIRPVERMVALFVASLWPGIGEAHVEAREREERRRQEEEVQARRREEEERAEKEENDRKTLEGVSGGGDGGEAASSSVGVDDGGKKAEGSHQASMDA